MTAQTGVAQRRIPLPAALERYRTAIAYLAIGGLAVVIDTGLFALLSLVGTPALLANSISVGTSMVFSFLTNAFLNFRVWDRLALRFLGFAAVTFVGWVISTLMLWGLADLVGWNDIVVKLLSLPVVVVVQYVLNSRITFSSPTSDPTRADEPVGTVQNG